MDPELKAYLEAMEMRLREHTENVETRLLSEFWTWARSSDLKSRQHPWKHCFHG